MAADHGGGSRSSKSDDGIGFSDAGMWLRPRMRFNRAVLPMGSAWRRRGHADRTPAIRTTSHARTSFKSDHSASFGLPDTNAAPAPHKQRQRALASARPSKTTTTPLEAIGTTISLFERRCAGGGRVCAGGGRRLHAVHGLCTRCGEAARPRAVHGRAHARVGSAFAALWISRSFSYLL